MQANNPYCQLWMGGWVVGTSLSLLVTLFSWVGGPCGTPTLGVGTLSECVCVEAGMGPTKQVRRGGKCWLLAL